MNWSEKGWDSSLAFFEFSFGFSSVVFNWVVNEVFIEGFLVGWNSVDASSLWWKLWQRAYWWLRLGTVRGEICKIMSSIIGVWGVMETEVGWLWWEFSWGLEAATVMMSSGASGYFTLQPASLFLADFEIEKWTKKLGFEISQMSLRRAL